MRILFTGGSSFTGAWFVRTLAQAGHAVTATFQKPVGGYTDPLRATRVQQVQDSGSRAVFGCSFGDDRFLALVRDEPWDLLCHHAADVTNYKSADFDTVAALGNNTRNLARVLEHLHAGGCQKMLLTGSVFENDEGAGSQGLPAFSPYGLSKHLTWEMCRYQAGRLGMSLGKFVIPNPFGPWEDPRFTAYLIKTWMAGKVAGVNTPAYVRDNIHISLLAQAYRNFAEVLPDRPGLQALRPSGYPESQGAFAVRFASEMRNRLGLACELALNRQTVFDEPRVRINTDLPDVDALGWDEAAAWDELAAYYRAAYSA